MVGEITLTVATTKVCSIHTWAGFTQRLVMGRRTHEEKARRAFIFFLYKHLFTLLIFLSTYYVADTILANKDSPENKRQKSFLLWSVHSSGGAIGNK